LLSLPGGGDEFPDPVRQIAVMIHASKGAGMVHNDRGMKHDPLERARSSAPRRIPVRIRVRAASVRSVSPRSSPASGLDITNLPAHDPHRSCPLARWCW